MFPARGAYSFSSTGKKLLQQCHRYQCYILLPSGKHRSPVLNGTLADAPPVDRSTICAQAVALTVQQCRSFLSFADLYSILNADGVVFSSAIRSPATMDILAPSRCKLGLSAASGLTSGKNSVGGVRSATPRKWVAVQAMIFKAGDESVMVGLFKVSPRSRILYAWLCREL